MTLDSSKSRLRQLGAVVGQTDSRGTSLFQMEEKSPRELLDALSS
jgi:hypothetical protein